MSSCPSSPEASTDGIPGVIRTAAANHVLTWDPGYSPKLSLDMASAHTWVPYAAAITALRSLTLTSLRDARCREEARRVVNRLYAHGLPFGAAVSSMYVHEERPARRFPKGEVYVCLDRAPFSRRMQGIVEQLARAEAAEQGEELASASSGYVRGIGDALDEITCVVVYDSAGAAVLYDRAVFESAFLLTWTEPEETGEPGEGDDI